MKQIYPLLGLTVMLAAVGCSNNSATETTASTNTTAPTTEPTSTQTAPAPPPAYTVVTETSNIPFAFLDEKANNIGFDIDIVNAIADNQGFSVNYAPASWERIFQEIDSGTADIAVSSISITPERQEKYSFSDPYISSKQLILTTAEHADKTTLKQFTKLPIASKPGTVSHEISKELGYKDFEVKEIFGGVQALRQGKVAGVIGDTGMILHYKNQPENSQFIIIDDSTIPQENFGIMVKSGNADLLNQINTGLINIKSDGTYQKIHEKWFGLLSNH